MSSVAAWGYTIHSDGSVFNASGKKLGSKKGRYARIKQGDEVVLLHRMVWEAFNGLIPKGMVIDHINSDTRDNSLSNLRLVTQHLNVLYQKAKGYCFHAGRNKPYQARIHMKGKTKSLGYYETAEEAEEIFTLAREELISKLEGELNL